MVFILFGLVFASSPSQAQGDGIEFSGIILSSPEFIEIAATDTAATDTMVRYRFPTRPAADFDPTAANYDGVKIRKYNGDGNRSLIVGPKFLCMLKSAGTLRSGIQLEFVDRQTKRFRVTIDPTLGGPITLRHCSAEAGKDLSGFILDVLTSKQYSLIPLDP